MHHQTLAIIAGAILLGRLFELEPLARYRVETEVADVYQGPGATFPVAGRLYRGQVIYGDAVLPGERGDPGTWVHLARKLPEQYDLGFVRLEQLRREPS